MNRVHLSILSQKYHTNINRKDSIIQLSRVCNPSPLQKGWISERFPLYPIQFDFYLANPPFNKIQIVFYSKFKPQLLEIFGSADGKQYFKFQIIKAGKDQFQKLERKGQLKEQNDLLELICRFYKQTHYYNYLRFRIYEEKQGFSSNELSYKKNNKNQYNLCKQIGIKAIQLSHVTIFNTKLQLHPSLFSLLQLYQYKAKMIDLNKDKFPINRVRNQIKQKYLKRINQIEELLNKNKIPSVHLEKEQVQKLNSQFEQILNQPMYQEQQLDLSNPVELKQTIKQLESELNQFYVDRLSNIHKNVQDYFQKYWNIEIRDIYLRLLSSPEDQDQTKALTQYWAEIKQLQFIDQKIQQATLMFLNYYLESIPDPIKLAAIKILCLFLKISSVGFKLYPIYQRILYNLIVGYLKLQTTQQMTKTFLKSIYTLYSKIPNSVFIEQFLNIHTHNMPYMKIKKLQILEKLLLNDEKFEIQSQATKDHIITFVLDILQVKELKVQQKNKAYNIVAFLANKYGKQQIMPEFQKLNTMILMNMEKIVDKKLAHIQGTSNNGQKGSTQRNTCDYCGVNNHNFKDQNIYDVHCFKECPLLIVCEYCSNVTQIAQLSRHYLQECSLKNKFKNCDNCNDVIFIDNEHQHTKKCLKNFITKCPLCQIKLESKLRIKQHLLKDGCPNNSRNKDK